MQWEEHNGTQRHARQQGRYDKRQRTYHTVEKDPREDDLLPLDVGDDGEVAKAMDVGDDGEVAKALDVECGGEGAEVLSEDEKVIQYFVSRVFSIPSCITKVCRVQKRKGYIKTSDLKEITENSILVDGEEFVGLIIFDFFNPKESQVLAMSLYKLCKTSGFVKRSKKLRMNHQFMYGARICNGVFDRYKQSIKPRGGGCLPGKQPPTATDIDFFSCDVVNFVYKKLKMHLSSWTNEWENMVPNLGTSYARLGFSPFTTMASTLDFYVSPHFDETDSGYGVIAWFERFFNPSICRRSLFRYIDYGIFIKPKQGTITIFKPAEVKHQTIQNRGYSQLGLALAVKKTILEAGRKHMEEVGFGLDVDETES